MTPKEFKIKLEALVQEVSDTPMSYKDKSLCIGILDYASFAFKLSFAQAVAEVNLKDKDEGETTGFSA